MVEDVVVKKFTFAISSADDFVVLKGCRSHGGLPRGGVFLQKLSAPASVETIDGITKS